MLGGLEHQRHPTEGGGPLAQLGRHDLDGGHRGRHAGVLQASAQRFDHQRGPPEVAAEHDAFGVEQVHQAAKGDPELGPRVGEQPPAAGIAGLRTGDQVGQVGDVGMGLPDGVQQCATT